MTSELKRKSYAFMEGFLEQNLRNVGFDVRCWKQFGTEADALRAIGERIDRVLGEVEAMKEGE